MTSLRFEEKGQKIEYIWPTFPSKRDQYLRQMGKWERAALQSNLLRGFLSCAKVIRFFVFLAEHLVRNILCEVTDKEVFVEHIPLAYPILKNS